MSRLRIYSDGDSGTVLTETHNPIEMAELLRRKGVRFERWPVKNELTPGVTPDQVITAYRSDIDRLMAESGYQAVDVISLNSEHPEKIALRQKFLSEHTHSEDEVRFFVAGSGLFSLHLDNHVYEVLCERGDLIGVPDQTPHWFDMGPNPNFIAIRLFTNPNGWVANFTGADIATHFSRHEN